MKIYEVLHKVEEDGNILYRRRKANRIGYILHRNFCLKDITRGKKKRSVDKTKTKA